MTQTPVERFNLRKFDLNLLPILRALLSTHSVARSSEMLCLSQSATSGALSRLRGMFGDPLLVQIGRNLAPTPRALELQPLVEEAFARLYSVFDQRAYVPDMEERCFGICTSDYAITECALPLLRLLKLRAPKASVRFIEVSHTHRSQVESGSIDCLLSPHNDRLPPDMNSLPLAEEVMVILASPSFDLPPAGLSLELYLASDHACFNASGAETIEQHALRTLGIKRRNIIVVPQFSHLPQLVADSHCLAMMPATAARRYATQLGLRLLPVPFHVPRFTISLYWSPLLDQDPPHIWFRALVAEAWTSGQDPSNDYRWRPPTGIDSQRESAEKIDRTRSTKVDTAHGRVDQVC